MPITIEYFEIHMTDFEEAMEYLTHADEWEAYEADMQAMADDGTLYNDFLAWVEAMEAEA